VRAVAERVREAYEASRPLRIRGAGTWSHAGRPTPSDHTVSLADDRGIVEYVPGDLTLTARAGTPLGDIVAATAAHGQWLPLDPWGGDAGTLGATISTATAGPHSLAMGLPRDVVLGMEFVNGRGDVIRAGGRVVKNVAGFDLTRLMVGSWGTLGIITEVTVRLRALPDHTRSVAIGVSTAPADLNALALRLRSLPFTLLASELVSPALASQLGVGSSATLLCRAGGNEKSLAGQLALLGSLGALEPLADGVWQRLRTVAPSWPAAWRFSSVPTRFGEVWSDATLGARALAETLVHGNPARGVVRVVANGDAAALAQAAGAYDGTTAIECLPAEAWPLIGERPAGDDVSRAIRRKFDPRGILNANILGDDT
jgi:glycolate oxidase FAD binding subunit